MCTSGAVRQSCWKEKGSNETQSNIDACSTKRKPPKLKPDEPHPPVNHASISRNLSDDGQWQPSTDSRLYRKKFIMSHQSKNMPDRLQRTEPKKFSRCLNIDRSDDWQQ